MWFKWKYVKDFGKLLNEKYSILESDIAEVYAAFILFYTLPVTVASEKSFSKLKIIKDYTEEIPWGKIDWRI